jgi:DNA-binding NtrC family response regulator
MPSITLIEDEKLLGSELKRRFEREGWQVTLSPTITDARRLLIDLGFAPTIVLSDMNLPDGNGLDFLEEVRAHGGASEWVFLSGYGTREDIARAADLGALDFLPKPLDYHKLDLTIATASRGAKTRQRLADTTRTEARKYGPQSFIGETPAARQVREMLEKLCAIPLSSILIGGETGVGKGLVAKILHYSGQRGDGPFIDVNCAAIPKDMLESELFGHEPGAFTGAKGRHRGLMEQADGGTLFLDEIGEMDPGLQSKLLTALEEQSFRRVGGEEKISVEFQLIAASNRNLRQSAETGNFRSDLYHRLSVFELTLPTLRERIADIDPLVEALLAEFSAQAGKKVHVVPPEVREALVAYDWPGNIRELRNVIERSVMLASDAELSAQWLGLAPGPRKAAQPPATAANMDTGTGTTNPAKPDAKNVIELPLDGSMTLEDMEEFIIRTALERHDYNVMAAVRALGTTRETLRYRIRKYGLDKLMDDHGASAPS